MLRFRNLIPPVNQFLTRQVPAISDASHLHRDQRLPFPTRYVPTTAGTSLLKLSTADRTLYTLVNVSPSRIWPQSWAGAAITVPSHAQRTAARMAIHCSRIQVRPQCSTRVFKRKRIARPSPKHRSSTLLHIFTRGDMIGRKGKSM